MSSRGRNSTGGGGAATQAPLMLDELTSAALPTNAFTYLQPVISDYDSYLQVIVTIAEQLTAAAVDAAAAQDKPNVERLEQQLLAVLRTREIFKAERDCVVQIRSQTDAVRRLEVCHRGRFRERANLIPLKSSGRHCHQLTRDRAFMLLDEAHQDCQAEATLRKTEEFRNFRREVWVREAPALLNDSNRCTHQQCAPPLPSRVSTGLQKAENPDGDMPDEDDEDDDEEIVVRGQKKSYKCPITQMDLLQPVQKYVETGQPSAMQRTARLTRYTWDSVSPVMDVPLPSAPCKHHYSLDAIMQLLGPRQDASIPCPVTGTANVRPPERRWPPLKGRLLVVLHACYHKRRLPGAGLAQDPGGRQEDGARDVAPGVTARASVVHTEGLRSDRISGVYMFACTVRRNKVQGSSHQHHGTPAEP